MKAKVGAVASFINRRIKYTRKFAPNLVAARASLIPFEDLFLAESAGPQNGGENEDPYFAVRVHGHGWCDVVEFTVRADGVKMEMLMHDPDPKSGEEFMLLDESDTTLAKMYDYLRQLPRPPHAYVRRGSRQ